MLALIRRGLALLRRCCLIFLTCGSEIQLVGLAMSKARHASRTPRYAPSAAREIHKQAYNSQSLRKRMKNGPRFRGYELAVYARRGAAAGPRLRRPAGRAFRHHPRTM